jgi:hypothetical protein
MAVRCCLTAIFINRNQTTYLAFIQSRISFNNMGDKVCSIAAYSAGEPVLHS